jgi:hypothetical protein
MDPVALKKAFEIYPEVKLTLICSLSPPNKSQTASACV